MSNSTVSTKPDENWSFFIFVYLCIWGETEIQWSKIKSAFDFAIERKEKCIVTAHRCDSFEHLFIVSSWQGENSSRVRVYYTYIESKAVMQLSDW